MEKNKNFAEKIYSLTRKIPHGRICTYGILAKSVGCPNSARMVGTILSKSFEQTEFVPAHRVVNRNGFLTGKFHFSKQISMQQLLENEGIIVQNDKVINFTDKLWIPNNETINKL